MKSTAETPKSKVPLALHDVAGWVRGGPNHSLDWMMSEISFRFGLIEEYAETTGAVLGGRDGFDATRTSALFRR
jgi:hypothetical protein